jgi:hypothetical protein
MNRCYTTVTRASRPLYRLPANLSGKRDTHLQRSRMRRIRHNLPALIFAVTMLAANASAQVTSSPPSSPPPAAPTLNFSGVLFGNFQYRTDRANRAINKFDVERAYLNFRMPVGERTNIRITTDIYQQQATPADAYYRGWAIRAKYAFVQHDFFKGQDASAFARLGLLNTVVIEHIESYWPRWMAQSSVERAGYFSSADMGFSTQLNLPRKFGELLGVVTNGPGYTSRELDRFKDYAARLSVTPLSSAKSPLIRSFVVSAWGYKGALASRFVAGGPGQVGPVNESLKRDRYGVFTAVRDARVTLALDVSRRTDESENGNNTAAVPRAVVDSTGSVTSAFAIVRPFQFRNEKSTVPFSALLRWDKVKPNADSDPTYSLMIAGLLWDLSKRTTMALDYQVQIPKDGLSVPESRTMFVHFVASF